MNFIQRVLHRPFFIKLFHWEYWPFNVVYAPIIFVWFWFCLRARSLFFFSASNPTIQNGGFLMESKMSIYDLIPQQYFPRTLFFPLHTAAEIVVASVREAQLKYPLIGKPDMGGRGRGVKKLDDEIALKEYAKTSPLDFLVQELNRETNTMGSKSNDAELTRHVVQIKSELEKVREQIQNVE